MTKDANHPIETIVEIGAAGGSMTLEGRRLADTHWQFRLLTDETALYDMLDEEPPPPEEPPWVASWDEALGQLDRYPWPRLHPVAVHPEFKDAVFTAVGAHEEGGPSQVERWRNLLAE